MRVPLAASPVSEAGERSTNFRSAGAAVRGRRAILAALFSAGFVLRFLGLSWNIEHHSAFPTRGVPTYHVDEMLVVEGMQLDFRPFSAYSLLVDGPLSTNLAYLPLAATGQRPPEHWKPANALIVGRAVSAISDCLALPVLWALLSELGVGFAPALFATAAFAFSPNNVFNAHFARSHTLANLLQLLVLLFTAKVLVATSRQQRALWFALSGLATLLAGSARYPLLTLGLFPVAATPLLLCRARREQGMARETAALGICGAFALALGLFLGFDFQPIKMLRDAFHFQSTAYGGQIPWSEARALGSSAANRLISIIDFPGGMVRLLLLPASLLALIPDQRRRSTALLLCAGLFAWACAYLVMWAKFAIPWQRYSIPLSTALLVLGAVGIDRCTSWARAHVALNRMRLARLGAVIGAALLLASPAYLCALIVQRFTADVSHPLYKLSVRLREEASGQRQLFVSSSWSWNQPLLQVAPPDRFKVTFVPSLEVACAQAKEGDLLLDLVVEPLRGSCSLFHRAVIFHSSNLGPAGYPFPADRADAPWAAQHYLDFHYLFEDVTLFRLTPPGANSP